MGEKINYKILHVDLSTRTITTETLSAKEFCLFLGGRGLNAKILYEGLSKGTDPLGPDNLIIFGVGKMVGTPIPTAGQMTITAKSPATGFYFKSNIGGGWAKAFRRAGWDVLVIRGASEQPIYISIEDSHVSIFDASFLWGKSVRETTTELEREHGHGWEIATIGAAGENLVNYACIMASAYHAAGRGGLGAVMGAKKLKAIAVRGTGSTFVEDPKGLELEIMKVLERIKDSVKANLYLNYGTAATIEYVNESWSLPVNNFKKCHLNEGRKLAGTFLVAKGYMRNGAACSACPMSCHKFSSVKRGLYKGYSGGPEYESLASLGGGLGITEVEAVLKANELCNDLGLDTISAGSAIQWLMESVDQGVLPRNIAGDINLDWGNEKALIPLLHFIAHRVGIGDLLAKGTRQAAEEVGGDSWKWAVQAHGLEQSRIDTRVAKAYALAFAVNPRGPDHLHAQPMAEFGHYPESRRLVEKLLGSDKYCNPAITEGKPELVRWHEDMFAVTDSLGICSFATTTSYIIDTPILLRLIKAAFGVEFTESDLLETGQRTVVLERCFNLREDMNRKDNLPWRIMHEPVAEGPLKGNINSPDELKTMLTRYYELQGYEPHTGHPTKKVLTSLGLIGNVKGIEAILSSG